MKKSIKLFFILFSFIFLTGQNVQGEPTKWKIDPIHTNFYFAVDHTYAIVRGYFEDIAGTFLFDEKNLKESKIAFQIKAKSINTNERKRNNHLRTDEFLDVKKYPLIRFESKSIKHDKGNQYLVEGDLTIKDVTKTLTIPLTYLGMKQNPLEPKEMVAGFESHLTLNRLDYHVGTGKYYEMGVVGKDVDILVTIEVGRKI